MFATKCVILLGVLHSINATRPYILDFLSYEHEYNTQFYERITLQLTNASNRMLLNGSYIFRRDVQELDLLLRLSVVEPKRDKPWVLLNVKTDFCKLVDVQRKKTMNFVYFIIESIRYYGKLIPDKCPYEKGIDYYLNNMYLDSERYPPYLPQMKLHVLIRLWHKTVFIYESNITVQVETKSRSKGKKL